MKRIAEKDLTFRARKSDKVIFPIDKKNVSNNKMSKKVRSEAELNKLIMDKYGERGINVIYLIVYFKPFQQMPFRLSWVY